MPETTASSRLSASCPDDDPRDVGAGHFARSIGHRLEGVTVGSRVGEQCGDLRGRREPVLTVRRLFVESCVLDGDARRGGERNDDFFVFLGEVAGTGFLGEVEVAEHPVADPDGDSEERGHRWVMLGEAVGRGVRGDLVEPNRLRVVDQQP